MLVVKFKYDQDKMTRNKYAEKHVNVNSVIYQIKTQFYDVNFKECVIIDFQCIG